MPLVWYDRVSRITLKMLRKNRRREEWVTVWNMDGVFDGDLAAGIIVGIRTMMAAIHNTNYRILVGLLDNPGPDATEALYIEPYDGTEREVDVLQFREGDWFFMHLANYTYIHDQPERNIPLHNVNPRFEYGFTWWIRNENADLWSQYEFRSSNFIQGFMSICRAFQVNSHDYTKGLWETKPEQEPELMDYIE